MSESFGKAVLRYKGVAGAFFFFLVFGLPVAIFGVWGAFEKDKTVPQWLAEQGWPSVTVTAGVWLGISIALTLSFYALLVAISRRLDRDTSEAIKPKLAGEIICVDINPNLTAKFSSTVYDCFLILTLRVHGKNAMATMISRWELALLWQGTEHPGTRENLAGYCYRRDYAHPADGRTNFERQWIPLNEFPANEEISDTNYKVGSVRFSVRSLPLEAISSGRLKEEITLRLRAFDSQGDPYLIYEGGTKRLASCGEIRQPAIPVPLEDVFDLIRKK